MFSVSALVRLYRYPIIGHLAQRMVLRRGADIPRSVKIGHRGSFPHNALGTVLHPGTTLEDYVKVYQNVTIGRGNIWLDYHAESRLRFTVKMGAILCAGCKIICSEDELVVGKTR